MKGFKRLYAAVIEIILGLALSVTGMAGIIDDYWSGMGTALITVGVIQLIRQIRYKTNTEYQQSVDVNTNDERNRFLSMKAWSWAGSLFMMISAVASIVLKIINLDLYSQIAAYSVSLIVLIYWISYMILRRKY